MASQRQAGRPGAAGPSGAARGAGVAKAAGPGAGKTRGGKAAAGKAQARAARAAAAQAEAAGGKAAPAAGRPSPLAGWMRARVPDGLPGASKWLQWTTFGLTLAGLGLSVYLTIVELQPAALVCSSNGLVNCANVLHSAEGKIAGIPVAFFGLAFYLAMAVLNSPWAWQRRELLVRRLRLASFVVGICFVLYLVYAELIEIGNICIWCTSVHIVTFLLFALIVFDSVFRQAQAPAAGRR